MLVVTDATPLRYLILIDQVAVLLALYERVIVPQAVIRELQHSRTPPIAEIFCGRLILPTCALPASDVVV
jgi:predicted nucleic acid-binding protein